jgi:hypothetical protein
MPSHAIAGAALAFAAMAAIVLAGVAVHELDYAADHPFRYGQAKVIAALSGGGVALAVAVGLLAIGVVRAGGDR